MSQKSWNFCVIFWWVLRGTHLFCAVFFVFLIAECKWQPWLLNTTVSFWSSSVYLGQTITSEELSQKEAIVPHLHIIYQSHTERFVLLVNRNWLTSQTDLISNYRKTLNILQTIVPAFYLPGLFQMWQSQCPLCQLFHLKKLTVSHFVFLNICILFFKIII